MVDQSYIMSLFYSLYKYLHRFELILHHLLYEGLRTVMHNLKIFLLLLDSKFIPKLLFYIFGSQAANLNFLAARSSFYFLRY